MSNTQPLNVHCITICLHVDIYKYMDLNKADPANATSLALQQPCRV